MANQITRMREKQVHLLKEAAANGTALHELIEGLSGEVSEHLLAQHCRGCIEDLVKAGCDPTAVNAQGKTPGLALEKAPVHRRDL